MNPLASQPIRLPSMFHVYIGSRSGVACINGSVYHFVYHPRRTNERMTPSDIRRLPMDALEAEARPVVTLFGPPHRVVVMRLAFSRRFRFVDNVYGQDCAFLALSTRNSTVRRIRASRAQRTLLAQLLLVREVQEGEDACFVCERNFPDAIFAPCSHARICCACAYQIVQTTRTCPLCRGGVVSFQRRVA